MKRNPTTYDNPVETLKQYQRERMKKLYNLAPPEIAKKEAPGFILRMQRYTIPSPYQIPSVQKERNREFKKKMKQKSSFYKIKRAIKTKIKSIIIHKEIKEKRKQKLSQKLNERDIAKVIKFEPFHPRKNAIYDKRCITCGERNLDVKYYKERHVCLQCRKLVKTYDGDRVVVFLNEEGKIECWAYKMINGERSYYQCDPEKMKVKGYRCYASYAGENELVILLHDYQEDLKNYQNEQMSKKNLNFK